ncbi:Bifunctional transcriptional activator/DNA repair enzyme Ada [compost metagenome]
MAHYIHYAMLMYKGTPCVLALSDGRICHFSFGVGEDSLSQEIEDTYPKYALVRVHPGELHFHAGFHTSAVVKNLVREISWETLPELSPIYLKATNFQRIVWQAIRRIPYGETRTYKQIAEEIGYPRACRAVARACATNNIALFVPCHRVISSSGAISGYKWGVHLKEQILKEESTNASTRRTSASSGTVESKT